MEEVEHVYIPNRESWRRWLEQNHAHSQAIWLVYDKGPARTMTWQDIVEEALCFGWIDSRPGKVSETQSKLYISKRKPKSVWSKINKETVARLTECGLMREAGYEAVRVAQYNGTWNALDLSDNLVYPEGLVEGFTRLPEAKRNFEAFPVGYRKNILQWIYDAKTPETQEKRISQTLESAAANTRIHS